MDGANRACMRQSIIASMRRVCERVGVKGSSIAEVAREAGITRELFYYYFSSKEEALDAMVEDYVDECIDCARLAVELPGELEGCELELVRSLRRILYDRNGQRRQMHAVLRELERDDEVLLRATRRVIDLLVAENVPQVTEEELLSCEVERRLLLAVVILGTAEVLALYPAVQDSDLVSALTCIDL